MLLAQSKAPHLSNPGRGKEGAQGPCLSPGCDHVPAPDSSRRQVLAACRPRSAGSPESRAGFANVAGRSRLFPHSAFTVTSSPPGCGRAWQPGGAPPRGSPSSRPENSCVRGRRRPPRAWLASLLTQPEGQLHGDTGVLSGSHEPSLRAVCHGAWPSAITQSVAAAVSVQRGRDRVTVSGVCCRTRGVASGSAPHAFASMQRAY